EMGVSWASVDTGSLWPVTGRVDSFPGRSPGFCMEGQVPIPASRLRFVMRPRRCGRRLGPPNLFHRGVRGDIMNGGADWVWRDSGETVPDSGQQLDSGAGSPPRTRERRKGRGRSSRPRMMGTDGGETERFESYVPTSGVRSLHIRP